MEAQVMEVDPREVQPPAPAVPVQAAAPVAADVLDAMLENLVHHLTFSEMQRLRLVSKGLNERVKTHPKYLQESVLVLPKLAGNEIRDLRRAGNINFADLPHWRKARLESTKLNKGRMLEQFWRPLVLPHLTCLEITKKNFPCTHLYVLIHDLPLLEELTLRSVHFKPRPRPMLPLLEPNRRPQPVNPNAPTQYCVHNNFPQQPPPQTLRRVAIFDMPVIPLCFMNLLTQRAGGQLTSFEYSETSMTIALKGRCVPDLNTQNRQMIDLLIANSGTLKNFGFCNNGTNNDLLRRITNLNPLNTWTHDELALGQPRDKTMTASTMVAFVLRITRNNPPHPLKKLDLTFRDTAFWRDLRNILNNPAFHQLRELTLKFCHLTARVQLDYDLRPFQHLKSLVVRQESNSALELSPEFLVGDKLPVSLEKLVIEVYGITPAMIRDIVCARHANLRALRLGKLENTTIGNAELAEIFLHFPLLEDLAIQDCPGINDFGLSGVNQKAADMLMASMNYDAIIRLHDHNNAHGNFDRFTIANLTALKRLDLSGCRNVSDVSITKLGPHLREINLSLMRSVTNFGILFMAKQNPGLEKVVLHYLPRVSQFGVVQLVRDFPSVRNLEVSKSIIDRILPGMTVELPPDFGNRVKVIN